MKQIIAVLLLSVGFYSFGFGFFIATRSFERDKVEDLRQVVYPDEKSRPRVRDNSMERYPVWLLLLCATGATFGFAGGVQLLLRGKTEKRKRPLKKK